ncbi:N-acetylglucosaminyl-phosphatidylinositol de-N-acetylase [Folsomia candida]|uniref:N-acetylglucosaminylphosphatidylinositol deacetylase n=1 Tax=Folsomia candida TaxID=158441 RepID=A0A226CYT2_FOLCA|nr:N-acetylglucosaminyl-phosphatidylinositol de-N-acetylase [Folsomia candida]OXA38123.1 N-acetylglucosaminyl-phosphatidylinositol de-N-acetylase [Folsomia candida]
MGQQWGWPLVDVFFDKHISGGGVAQICGLILVTLLILIYSIIYTVTFLTWGKRSSPGLWGWKGVCSKRRVTTTTKKCRVLLAIAHPDDEVMFFGPTILNLLRDGHSVYILCFSYGDSEGQGLTRKSELWKSCRVLGVPDENVTIIKHDHLKDGMTNRWPILPLSAHIRSFLNSYGIDTLITFDRSGVSGHLNHISVHNAAQDLVERNLLPNDCEVYSLKSVGFFRQYALNLFNIPLSYFFNQFVHVARGSDYKTIVKAMKSHSSQMLWYRHLHILFSMYLVVNIFQKISRPITLASHSK